MKIIRNYRLLVILSLFVLLCIISTPSQTNTNIVSDTEIALSTNTLAPFEPKVGVLPSTKQEFWTYAISFITLGLMQIAKKIPKLPDWMIPILAPGVGILLGLGLRYLGQLNAGWVDMGAMGGLATWIHQMAIQVAHRRAEGPPPKELS